jgi:hypothetical protein
VVAPVFLGPRLVELFWEEDSDLLRWSACEVRCAALRFAAMAGGRAWAQVCCATVVGCLRDGGRVQLSTVAERDVLARFPGSHQDHAVADLEGIDRCSDKLVGAPVTFTSS